MTAPISAWRQGLPNQDNRCAGGYALVLASSLQSPRPFSRPTNERTHHQHADQGSRRSYGHRHDHACEYRIRRDPGRGYDFVLRRRVSCSIGRRSSRHWADCRHVGDSRLDLSDRRVAGRGNTIIWDVVLDHGRAFGVRLETLARIIRAVESILILPELPQGIRPLVGIFHGDDTSESIAGFHCEIEQDDTANLSVADLSVRAMNWHRHDFRAPSCSGLAIGFVQLDPHGAAPAFLGGYQRRTATQERIKHPFAWWA